ncbi:MAG: hypothetical protein DMG57_28425 [Acidobacteria bacterium]|nr:MAG: hypothetical protein DMG57_28425 [Acidobacteriota bacterium]
MQLQLPLHEIESQQQTKGGEVQRLLLQAHLERRGDGDVGPALRVSQQAGTVLCNPSSTPHPLSKNHLWSGGD